MVDSASVSVIINSDTWPKRAEPTALFSLTDGGVTESRTPVYHMTRDRNNRYTITPQKRPYNRGSRPLCSNYFCIGKELSAKQKARTSSQLQAAVAVRA